MDLFLFFCSRAVYVFWFVVVVDDFFLSLNETITKSITVCGFFYNCIAKKYLCSQKNALILQLEAYKYLCSVC